MVHSCGGTVAQWKEFCPVTRKFWVQLPPILVRSNPGQVACLSLSDAEERQLAFCKNTLTLCNVLIDIVERKGNISYNFMSVVLKMPCKNSAELV